MKNKKIGFNSKLIHGGEFNDALGSATVPIYQTSTFRFQSAEHGAACFTGESDGYIYTRISNPTIHALETLLTELENGYGGIATSSGMGAVNTVFGALLAQGNHIVCSEAIYSVTRIVLETYYKKFGVVAAFVNTTDIEEVRKAIRPETRLLYIETPSNPTMEISDLKACCELAHEHGIPVAVDNTFCSPYLQRPIDFGADIVLHSLTKFINGHADIVGGVVIAKDESMYRQLHPVMVSLGFNMDPHQAYLVIRGVKTLGIRMDRAQESAMKIAAYLENHPKVGWVRYPGLASHPQHQLAKTQMDGFGSMISFELKGGIEAGRILMNSVQLAILAVSLGGVETLIQHPASMTHSKVSAEGKVKAGITDGLVRYSVGIEDVADLIADLDQALGKI
ncbi:MAG: aminotransferase class I/II-fold pyridoxal phosphate-dependent enzyme [Lentimicrobiaceae bacterium]|jgi:methionine-gamma-lyase